MSKLRFKVVEAAFKKKALEVAAPKERPAEYFAKYVFNKDKMRKYLPAETCRQLYDVIEKGTRLDLSVADEVAKGMKRWAQEFGVTHITHWFQPLTEGTAEKHDSFIKYGKDQEGLIEDFSGTALVQQEPDASSFPSGGIRSTFEARGYSAWDPASPVFVIGDTLMIPTVFISYTGEALDYKAPLKKALAAMDKAATAVCQYFDPSVTKVTANLGWEQEYFLVDEDQYAARPPAADGPHAGGPRLGQEPADGGPLLRRHTRPRSRVYEGPRDTGAGAGHPLQDTPQRGGAQSV